MTPNNYDAWEKVAREKHDRVSEFSNTFRTPNGLWDLAKLRSKTEFPLYILLNDDLPFILLHNVNIAMREYADASMYIHHISLRYIAPNYFQYDRALVILSGKREELPKAIYAHDLLLNLSELLPVKFQNSYNWKNLKGIWNNRVLNDYNPEWEATFCQQIVWEFLGTSLGLGFNMFYQDDPGPLLLAYSEGETGYVCVGGVGAFRSEIFTILSSLVSLQEIEVEAINRLQETLAISRNRQ